MKSKKMMLSTAAATLLLLAGCTPNNANKTKDAETTKKEDPVEISKEVMDVSTAITEAVQKTEGAVVSIINLKEMGNYGHSWLTGGAGEEDEEESSLQPAGTGSGAIYKITDDRAYIFTNHHVIEGGDSVEVLFDDGRHVEGKVEGADVWTDLAVISIPAEGVKNKLEFGDSDKVKVGEPAIAIGSPLGTEFASSVTSGIISAKNRTLPVDTDHDKEPDWEMTVLQTDAAINPGNSGGPLINIEGQVIGINSMKISVSEVEGMGFAIPSTEAIAIIRQLEEKGEVVRPALGVSIVDLQMVSKRFRDNELNLPDDVREGVLITQTKKGGSAEAAGLQAGDVIVEMGGEPVENSVDLRRSLYQSKVGDAIEVTYYRSQDKETKTVKLLDK
ncbi:S1C family serine protease [Allofustis seminis]|uniref:S1C family serine protease n=1 Tax=Allofustis seminis TaxID=166939 RepID=UPI00036A87DC|nr:trypsin-like peptidase domain-containing protein [Allofustis seminis]